MNQKQSESSNKSSTSIKNWAMDDRPREKLVTKGKEALSDSELLAILLQTGSGKKSAVDLAKEILQKNDNKLNNLSKQSLESLMKVKGIGQAKAITIIAAMELGRRREATASWNQKFLSDSANVASYLQNLLKDHHHEVFVVLFLNSRNTVLHHEVVSTGGINFTVVDHRLIFHKAIELKAVKLILCHNHPSGNLNPSAQDELLTDKINKAGKLLDIRIVDHLIVSEEGYYSFADNGKL